MKFSAIFIGALMKPILIHAAFLLWDNLQILQETVFLRISSHSLTEEILNGTLHFSIFV